VDGWRYVGSSTRCSSAQSVICASAGSSALPRAIHELLSGQPAPSEPEADRKAHAAHDRETVSQYIERYRASGLELFERGVAERRIVDTLRPMFKQPNSPYDLSQMVDVIATLEERIR
jgi:hypothetical protein